MANWTIKFTDRTDGVTMFGDMSVPNMAPIPEAGLNINTAFTTTYCFYTCDNEFTVNDNIIFLQYILEQENHHLLLSHCPAGDDAVQLAGDALDLAAADPAGGLRHLYDHDRGRQHRPG